MAFEVTHLRKAISLQQKLHFSGKLKAEDKCILSVVDLLLVVDVSLFTLSSISENTKS